MTTEMVRVLLERMGMDGVWRVHLYDDLGIVRTGQDDEPPISVSDIAFTGVNAQNLAEEYAESKRKAFEGIA